MWKTSCVIWQEAYVSPVRSERLAGVGALRLTDLYNPTATIRAERSGPAVCRTHPPLPARRVHRPWSRSAMAVLAAMGVTLVAPPALANGRFPAASQLVAHPRDPARMVLRTTYGLLVTRDNGTSWDWICERAVGYGGVEDPALAITGGGTLLAGIFEGLVSSSDEGCTWSRSPGLPQ